MHRQVSYHDIGRLHKALEQTPRQVVFAPSANAIVLGIPANEVFKGPFREVDCITGIAIMGENASSPLRPVIIGLNAMHHVVMLEDDSLRADGWKRLRNQPFHAFIPEEYFQ